MTRSRTLTDWPPAGQSTITVKFEVTTQVNVSAFVARQKANRYLILQAGDQLCADRPELVIEPVVRWQVPVQYAPSRRGVPGIVGHLLVDAETGEVTIADNRTLEDMLEGADTLHERATLGPGS